MCLACLNTHKYFIMGIFDKPKLPWGPKTKDLTPDDQWVKCPSCTELIHDLDLRQNLHVCTKCDHHFLIGSRARIEALADEGTFQEMDADLISQNPLDFPDYEVKSEIQRTKSGLNDAVISGRLMIGGKPATIAVMDFKYFAGSMGSVVGEKIARAIEVATAEKSAVIVVSASSGARMQEGLLSLMQMAKTCGALARHAEAKLPYISIMTHPTTGGVSASFATVGDINIAEPKCMIGFAGPRVIKETTHQDLPAGFQTAEFMVEHGLVDRIIHRKDMKAELAKIIDYTLS